MPMSGRGRHRYAIVAQRLVAASHFLPRRRAAWHPDSWVARGRPVVEARCHTRPSRVVTVVSQAGRLSISASGVCSRSHAGCTMSWVSASSPSARPAIPHPAAVAQPRNVSAWLAARPFTLLVTALTRASGRV